ncbi:hypothetical protein CY35_09G089700 [Sphagnum magellanicum]|nr:hypothetical protein CY35_09G089700 [Sphagnum magellanicum]
MAPRNGTTVVLLQQQLDIFAWNRKLARFFKAGQHQKAMELYQQLLQQQKALEEGRRAHEQFMQCGCCETDVFVGNSLVDIYAKCGSMEDAQRVFDKMPSWNVVTWTAMMLGLGTFELLNACASEMVLEESRCIHEQIIKCGCQTDGFVRSSLVDMYAKCGSMDNAHQVFKKMLPPSLDVVTWNAMIFGHVKCAEGLKALELVQQMQQEGVQPDSVTFVRPVDEGVLCYALMGKVYMISAKLDHYTCIVDLLDHSGHLQEAENVIKEMPCKPNAAVWTAFLGICRIHGNMEMGKHVAKQVLELEPENAAVELQRKERGVKKQPAPTCIEVNNEVCTFVVEDQDHPQMVEIHAEPKRLSGLMNDTGYVLDTKYVLHDVEEEEKALHLFHHSEKLAIAFGLMSMAPGTPLHII